eukprot:scaffold1384_cov116-Cylindrotheca_fusiformis.AAC.10
MDNGSVHASKDAGSYKNAIFGILINLSRKFSGSQRGWSGGAFDSASYFLLPRIRSKRTPSELELATVLPGKYVSSCLRRAISHSTSGIPFR